MFQSTQPTVGASSQWERFFFLLVTQNAGDVG